GLTLHALSGRTRQHAVLGGDPTLTGTTQKARHAGFDTGGADDLGIAEFNQHRPLGVAGVMAGQANRAQLIGGAAAGSYHVGFLVPRLCAAIIRGPPRGTTGVYPGRDCRSTMPGDIYPEIRSRAWFTACRPFLAASPAPTRAVWCGSCAR